MASTIITKNSITASAVPVSGDLVRGELALNLTDGRIYSRDEGTTIVELGINPSTIAITAGTIDNAVIGATTAVAGTFTNLTATGTLTGTLATDAQPNITSLGTIASLVATTADINGGTIDGTVIGGTTPAAISGTIGQFSTSLNVDGTATMDGLAVVANTPQIDFIKASSADVLANIRAETDAGSGGKLVFQTKRNGNTALDRMAIDDDGNVGIGTDTPTNSLTLDKNDNNFLQIRSSDTGHAGIYFGRQNDSVRGAIIYDNSNESIQFLNNNYAERMRISSSGAILAGTASAGSAGAGDIVASGGVYLGGTGAANKLDDYEEGTWTPTLDAGTGITYTSQTGRYRKVGGIVTCTAQIVVSNSDSDGSTVAVGGLPFVTGSNEECCVVTLGRYIDFLGTKATAMSNVRFSGGGLLLLEGNNDGITYSEVASSGTLQISFTYIT